MLNCQQHLLEKSYQQPLVKVAQTTPMVEAIAQMLAAGSNYILVLNRQRFIGIITEIDILRAAANQVIFAQMTVAELMRPPVATITAAELENVSAIVQRFEQLEIDHLPVVDRQKRVQGLLTLEDVKAVQQIQDQTTETKLNDILNDARGASIACFRVFPNYDWQYDYQSPGSEDLFGYTPEELITDKHLWLSRVHPQDVETVVMPGYADIFAGNRLSMEYRFYHKDGSLRWIGSTQSSRYDPEANCWIVVASNIDITQRKQAEAALRESEERWQLAIAGTNEAIWDWNILTNYTYRSQRWFEMLGYERDELSSYDDEWSARIHPDDYKQVMADQAAYLRREIPFYQTEYRIRCKDGNYRWFRSRAKALWDQQGNPLRLVGSIADITEHKNVETALVSSEAQYRLLFENNPNVMWIFDPETRDFLAVNQAAIHKYGYSQAEFLSMKIFDIRPPEAISALLQALSDANFVNQTIYVTQTQHLTKAGNIIDVEINSHRITWKGKPAKFVLAKDITQQKAALRELQQVEAELRERKHFIEQVINSSAQLLYILDPITWKNIYLNRQSVDILGYTPEEIQQRGPQFFLDVLHPDDLHLLQRNQNHWKTARDGEVLTTEYRMRHQDGSWRWLRSRDVVFARDENNRPNKVLGTTQDITDSKEAELEIIHNRDLLEAIYNGSTDAIFLVNSQTLLITDCNQRALELFGFTDKSELIGTEGQYLQKQRFTPQELDSIVTELNEQGYWSREVEYITKQGHCFWGNLAVKTIYVAGEQINLVRVTDISQRKLAEMALHERETMLRNIGDNVPNGALYKIVRELDGSDGLSPAGGDRFYYLSAGIERIQEIKPEDAIRDANLLLNQFLPEYVSPYYQAVDESMRNLSVFDHQVRILTPSGLFKWLQFRSKPRTLGDGRIAWDGLVVDITEIKNTEETLRQSEAWLIESQQVARLGNWEYEIATGKVSWSQGMFDLLQLDPALGEPTFEEHANFVHPEDWPILQEAVKMAVSAKEGYKLILREFTTDGSLIYSEAIGQVSLNEQGQITRLYGTVQDITSRIQAEQALFKSEAQLRLTIELTHIGVWDWNIQTNELIWNENHYRLLGLQLQTPPANYQLWRNAVHPDDITWLEQKLDDALQQHTDYEAEYRVVHPNKDIRWVAARGRGVYNAAGEPIRMLGVVIDVHERKQTEQTIQEKEHFLRSIYEGVNHSIFVIDVINDNFFFMGLNSAHEHLTGLTSQTIKGKTPEDFLRPDDAAIVRSHYRDCLQAGETITYEENLYLNNQDTWWITSLNPLKDENGKIHRIIGSSINITEQKRAQKMLELQAVITRNMAEGLCLIRESDGVIVYTNPKFEDILGYDSGELIGQPIWVINYEDEQTTSLQVHEAIAAAVIEYSEATYEVLNIKKDGTPLWCQATTSMFEHPEYGKVFVVVQQDITEKKQAQEKVKASLKEKEVLLQEIHHRVKNNLGIVSSLLQMQCRRTQDPQAKAILRDSQNRIASIALVHEKLYRSEDLANIDFAQYIADLTIHLFDSYNVSSNHIKLKIAVDNVNLDIEAAIPCGLIINELVSNALKYAFIDQKIGEINVNLFEDEQENLTLIVRDNGIGLPPNFHSHKSKTLGINLVQGLVKQLRGKLDIKNYNDTEFKIIFPKTRI